MRKIAISDIHGCLLTFQALLDKIALSTSDELYLLGDYIDRGPDSKGVIDQIFKLRDEGYQVHCLKGNHEFGLINALSDSGFFKEWRTFWGGRETLESFSVEKIEDIPLEYLHFCTALPFTFEVDNYILVHAGLDFSTFKPMEETEILLFVRDWYHDIDYDWLGERIIVHGHTPLTQNEVKKMAYILDENRVIDIDSGCFVNHIPGNGYLCAFDLNNRELFFQKNRDDVSGYWSSR